MRKILPGRTDSVQRASADEQRQIKALSVEGNDGLLVLKQSVQTVEHILFLIVIADPELRNAHLAVQNLPDADFKGDRAGTAGETVGFGIDEDPVLRRKMQPIKIRTAKQHQDFRRISLSRNFRKMDTACAGRFLLWLREWLFLLALGRNALESIPQIAHRSFSSAILRMLTISIPSI